MTSHTVNNNIVIEQRKNSENVLGVKIPSIVSGNKTEDSNLI